MTKFLPEETKREIEHSRLRAKIWDKRFMQVASLVASWSKDPSTKIGIVIVKDRKIVATGYNGFPQGIADDDRLNHRNMKYPLIVHGEMNAILQAGRKAHGATMYLYSPFGGFPCQNCAKHVITAGIVRVVGLIAKENERWSEDCERARITMEEAFVTLDEVSL